MLINTDDLDPVEVVVFGLSGAQARPVWKIFCKQRLLVHR
ncbi:hypothetical protein CDHC02_0223 [Corynebacterium diphtheriae HC02]|nr:hypothetical protein CDHC02_0223 [Corynebacterium diphtheriae HC02]